MHKFNCFFAFRFTYLPFNISCHRVASNKNTDIESDLKWHVRTDRITLSMRKGAILTFVWVLFSFTSTNTWDGKMMGSNIHTYVQKCNNLHAYTHTPRHIENWRKLCGKIACLCTRSVECFAMVFPAYCWWHLESGWKD